MNKKIRVGVLGAGAWGTTISLILSEKNNVLLWANEKKVVQEIKVLFAVERCECHWCCPFISFDSENHSPFA